jgi:hypothetical protein
VGAARVPQRVGLFLAKLGGFYKRACQEKTLFFSWDSSDLETSSQARSYRYWLRPVTHEARIERARRRRPASSRGIVTRSKVRRSRLDRAPKHIRGLGVIRPGGLSPIGIQRESVGGDLGVTSQMATTRLHDVLLQRSEVPLRMIDTDGQVIFQGEGL